MKRAIIIHCWEGYPEYCWYPWVKNELAARGFRVEVPAFPDPAGPRMEAWLARLREAAGEPDEELYLIGHSLGCATIMRYLETLAAGEKTGGAVFVAGFDEDMGYEPMRNFFVKPFDWEKIKAGSQHGFVAIHSDDDPFVDLRYAEVFRARLGAAVIVKHGAKHFSAAVQGEAACRRLPELIQSIEGLYDHG